MKVGGLHFGQQDALHSICCAWLTCTCCTVTIKPKAGASVPSAAGKGTAEEAVAAVLARQEEAAQRDAERAERRGEVSQWLEEAGLPGLGTSELECQPAISGYVMSGEEGSRPTRLCPLSETSLAGGHGASEEPGQLAGTVAAKRSCT